MLLRAFLFLLPGLLFAEDWLRFRSGPFEVLSTAGDREGREALNRLEQLRNAIELTLGSEPLQPAWPIRIVLRKPGRQVTFSPKVKFARDAWMASAPDIKGETITSITQLLLDSYPGVIPPRIERGLVSVFATLRIEGTRVTLGDLPERKDRDWSRVHMLAVSPDYSGKIRVLLRNLGKGVEPEVAYKNAFEKTEEQIERELDRYMEAGNYGTVPVSGLVINPRRMAPVEVDAYTGAIALADLLLANPPSARAAYEALASQKPGAPEPREGLALVALAAGDKTRARTLLSEAVTIEQASARAVFELAALETDDTRKRALLTRTVQLAPRWSEPHRVLAGIEGDGGRRVFELKKAAELAPRNPELWKQLAMAQEAVNQFADAGKSWAMAERTSDDLTVRNDIRQARAASQERRVEQQFAAAEEARRKAQQEVEDLKNRALSEIRAAEARANAGKPEVDISKLDFYKEEEDKSKQASGVLDRVDCMGIQARLYVTSGKKSVRLLVKDPSKVAITGGGERSFGCGVQRPARPVNIRYEPEVSKTLGTVGAVVSIEFR